MRSRYDVVIVGAGPAGIFAALELAKKDGLRILQLEKGKSLEERPCAANLQDLAPGTCAPRGEVSGWGGAGAFSDGKLTLSSEIGGRLGEYLPTEEVERLIRYVDDVYLKFGASEQVWGTSDEIDQLRRRASQADLRLVPFKVRHLGTERCFEILQRMHAHLTPQIDIVTRTAAAELLVSGGRVHGVRTNTGDEVEADYVIVAPGREGSDWLNREAHHLGISLENNPVDVGVRVEVPAVVLAELTDVLYEAKLEFFSRSFDDRIRTFCVCPHGEVTTEYTAGPDPLITVNGHSYADKKTDNSNFALLVSTNFSKPFHEPIAYGRHLARLANFLSGGVMVQRLGDLLAGRRSTPERIARNIMEPTLKGAAPGDLSFVLPYRYLKDIIEMLEALDKLAPGVNSRHTLLYGVEVKFYSSRVPLTQSLESTDVANLFAIGDGAGVTRGLIQSSASGVVAAREILRRLDPVNNW